MSLAFFQHKLKSLVIFIVQVTFQDGFPDSLFDISHYPAWWNTKRLHDDLPGDGGLPISKMILRLHILQFQDYFFIVPQIAGDTIRVFGSNIRFAKQHEIFKIITSIKQQSANS